MATKRGNSTRVPPKKTVRQFSGASDAGAAERRIPPKSSSAEKYQTSPRIYRFQRAKAAGIIEVLDENSYVMAEYSERTGTVRWQRMVLASQREAIEKWLSDHYTPRITAP